MDNPFDLFGMPVAPPHPDRYTLVDAKKMRHNAYIMTLGHIVDLIKKRTKAGYTDAFGYPCATVLLKEVKAYFEPFEYKITEQERTAHTNKDVTYINIDWSES